MKHAILNSLFFLIAYSLSGQSNSYTPAKDVIESSMLNTSLNGKESAFFITSNMKKDSSTFIELVFTSQMPMAVQLQELKSGMFKNAFLSIDSNKLQFLYIHQLANTGDLAKEINVTYFSRFKENSQDSLPQRLQTYLRKSALYQELNNLLESHNLVINKMDIVNEGFILDDNNANAKKNKSDKSNQYKIDAEIYFYVKHKNE